ncbi:MAG: hypothetical protein D6714_13475, partial [Bacteroidetes bacterium]
CALSVEKQVDLLLVFDDAALYFFTVFTPCCGHKKLKTPCHFPRGEPPDEGFILNLVLKL